MMVRSEAEMVIVMRRTPGILGVTMSLSAQLEGLDPGEANSGRRILEREAGLPWLLLAGSQQRMHDEKARPNDVVPVQPIQSKYNGPPLFAVFHHNCRWQGSFSAS
jgi:hypothetical protein